LVVEMRRGQEAMHPHVELKLLLIELMIRRKGFLPAAVPVLASRTSGDAEPRKFLVCSYRR
jgi:hypothetical protein